MVDQDRSIRTGQRNGPSEQWIEQPFEKFSLVSAQDSNI